MKIYKVIDKQGANFMGYQLWTIAQARAHCYALAKNEWDEVPLWKDFTIDFICEMWGIELELQEDLG